MIKTNLRVKCVMAPVPSKHSVHYIVTDSRLPYIENIELIIILIALM